MSEDKSQNDTRIIQISTGETHILSFQLSENKDPINKNKGNIIVSSFSKSEIGGVKKTIRYRYTGKTLLEIYRLVSQNIPHNEFFLSNTLTAEQTSLLAQRFDLDVRTIHSPETAKEIFRKLDAVSGLQTDISEVDTVMFILKEIKESNRLKKIKTFIYSRSAVGSSGDSFFVNGKMSSEQWLSLIKKELNVPVSMDKSLENNFYRAKDLTFKKDSTSIDQQLIYFKEAGLVIERELGTKTIINIR